MSAYVRATDRIRFYEINQEIIDINRQPDPYFTFIRDCPGQIVTVPGDARLSLEHEVAEIGTQQFDLLVIDAFSSDSIPVHVLTIEAFRVFSAHLKTPDSILAIHVTNRHLDLEPVVAANTRELGFHSVFVDSTGDPPAKSGV